ncbi:MAG TPA: hypothetical protein PLZ26_05355 [Bacteroidia bacterium]|nr:hypothetical protein [Bacteroidia bacterium]
MTATLLENHSKFNPQIQEALMQTYLDWLTEHPMTNLYINKNQFLRYTKQRNKDLSGALISLFIETLLSKELFIHYQLRNKEREPMDWYQPESALYKLGDEINELSKEISMRTNLFIITTENIEKFDELSKQLESLKRKLNDCLYCLKLYRYSKNQTNNDFDETDINKIRKILPLELLEKLSNRHILVFMRLLKTDCDLEETIRLFKVEANVALTEDDFLKITEALWILSKQEKNSSN